MPEKPNYIPEENLEPMNEKNEKKDIQSQKPLYIMYRDNDLYTEIVPKIKAELEDLGRTVEVVTVPRDVSEMEMTDRRRGENDFLPNRKELEELQPDMLSDETTRNFLFNRIGTGTRTNLDELAQEIFIPLILDLDSPEAMAEDDPKKQIEVIGKFVGILKQNHPETGKVNIISYALDNHLIKGKSFKVAELIKEELLKYFNGDKIKTVFKVDELTNADREHSISISDRHHIQRSEERDKLGSNYIILPTASAALDLINKGEIQVDQQSIDDNIKKVVDKYFNR